MIPVIKRARSCIVLDIPAAIVVVGLFIACFGALIVGKSAFMGFDYPAKARNADGTVRENGESPEMTMVHALMNQTHAATIGFCCLAAGTCIQMVGAAAATLW